MAIWHPTKWWYQDVPGTAWGIDTDERYRVFFGPKGEPWGQLDSGRYWLEYDDEGNSYAIAPSWYQCLSCCCAPAKCKMPDEVLMIVNGFDGTMSSIDYPSDYGYGPTNVCPECKITYVHNCEFVQIPPYDITTNVGCWSGFNEPGCCECMARENYYWWPRDLTATGRDKCSLDRPICNIFPHLCAAPAQPVKYFGRIANRWMPIYGGEGCSFCWSLDDKDPDGNPIDVITPTDCAGVPGISAQADYNCLSQIQSPFTFGGFLPPDYEKDASIVRAADSYLFPPGFKGVQSKNLLPLCGGRFWNDSTYYRFCAKGGFWCDNFFEDFPDPRQQSFREPNNLGYNWCEASPTRCSEGPIDVNTINWQYYRPKFVLISQPSRENCGSCFSGISNPLLRDDPYNPWSGSQDGHCNGKTDVAMADFNRAMVMRARIYNAPPLLTAVSLRRRVPPNRNTRLIDAQLLYETFSGGYETARWHIDYPCEPKVENQCTLSAGLIQPKLRAFYTGNSGYRANIEFDIRIYCPPPVKQILGYGSTFNGGWWYVSDIRIKAGDTPLEANENKGVGYKVGDVFVFDYFENPLRGGESYWPTYYNVKYQEAEVLEVGPVGQILKIQLRHHNGGYRRDLPLNIGCDPRDPPIVQIRRPPLYGRFVPHRYAVAVPGNGYLEGDVLEFEARQGAPNGNVETGSKFRPFLSTNVSVRSKARVTVIDVDSRGGILDWHLCGAENAFGPQPPWDQRCSRYDRGDYYDLRYADKCEYEYQGYLPVRYGWSGVSDVRFRGPTYCEHAWAEFFFKIQQISVKNDIQVIQPLQLWGRQAKLKIAAVTPEMTINGVRMDPVYFQNYETSPGPNNYTDNLFGSGGYQRKHPLPIVQGGVLSVEIVDPGAGYLHLVKNPDDPEDEGYYAPMELSTANRRIKIRSVMDDMRLELKKQGLSSSCELSCTINMDPESENYGGIASVSILNRGCWYFAHQHDHIWFAQVGTNWFFELSSPIVWNSEDFTTADCAVNISSDQPCCHATRDNWGELQHYDGFVEPYLSGYYFRTAMTQSGFKQYYQCGIVGLSDGSYAWPNDPKTISGNPGYSMLGNYRNRWSTNFCPTDLLQRTYRMIMLHPCAACAKELGIPGGQTCWNMNGFGDSTYSPPGWQGTGTAFISQLAGPLTCRIALPKGDL